jgi:hypothetical protein
MEETITIDAFEIRIDEAILVALASRCGAWAWRVVRHAMRVTSVSSEMPDVAIALVVDLWLCAFVVIW